MIEPTEPLRLLLVDDHFFVRMGLADSLRDEGSIEVVGQATSGGQAIEMFVELRPDVMILDLLLPDMRGTEVLTELSRRDESFRCLMLSVNESEEDIFRCVEAGASAYLPKSTDRSELIRAIQTVAGGGSYFPADVERKLQLRRDRSNLTPRELQALEFLVGGFSNKEIASAMKISQATVKLHIGHLFQKLEVMDRTQAVTAAIQRGIVHLD